MVEEPIEQVHRLTMIRQVDRLAKIDYDILNEKHEFAISQYYTERVNEDGRKLHPRTSDVKRTVEECYPVLRLQFLNELKQHAIWKLSISPSEGLGYVEYPFLVDEEYMRLHLAGYLSLENILFSFDEVAYYMGCEDRFQEEFIKLHTKKQISKDIRTSIDFAIEKMKGYLQQSGYEKETTAENLSVLDLDTQLKHMNTTCSDILFDRLQKCVPQALQTLKITGQRKELALRGAKMFDYYYNKGIHQDVAALQIIEENNLSLGEAAIIKNMNKNFVQDRVLGAAGETAVHDIIVPEIAKPLGANNEPDFILEDKKTIFEVKWRINNSKARSVKWLIENECKYLYRYLTQGYQLHFVYVLYSKQRCEVQQWTLTPVLDIAP